MTAVPIRTITIAFLLALLFLAVPVTPAQAACTNPAGAESIIVYNVDHKVFQYCNGTDWVRMNPPGSGSGGCVLPALPEGEMAYNEDYRVMQGCAGNQWKAMGAIGGKHDWVQISAGSSHTCGITSDDSLWCWGSNASGQLGDNSTTERLVPTAVNGGGAWKQVAAGGSYTCGITSDDSLWCWGSNGDGELTATELSSPYRLTGVQPWCGNPAGKEAMLIYNSDFSVMQYCDGVGWVRIGK